MPSDHIAIVMADLSDRELSDLVTRMGLLGTPAAQRIIDRALPELARRNIQCLAR